MAREIGTVSARNAPPVKGGLTILPWVLASGLSECLIASGKYVYHST